VAVDGGAGDTELVGDLLDGVVAGVVHLPRKLDLPGAELGFQTRFLSLTTSSGSRVTRTESVNGAAPDCLWGKLQMGLQSRSPNM
jgi:hypothetical protein